MINGELHILPTNNTPEFLFNPDGMLTIKGRGLYQTNTEDIEQIMNWIDEYLSDPAETTYIIIAFEYLNSFSTTIIVSILRKLSNAFQETGKLAIYWYYEEDDEAMIEEGECISSTFNIPMDFIITDHIADP